MPKQPILFLAFANARTEKARYLRNLPEEARQLEAALNQAQQSDLCELIIRHNVTAEEVFNTFQNEAYRDRIAVFHFAGHANGYQLLLESNTGASEAAHAQGLAHLLGQQRGLQLVFLNGCSTTAQSETLLQAGIPMVISTTQTIDDRIATTFAQRFYAGLGSGASLKRAFHVAEARIEFSQPSDAPKRGVTLETAINPEPDSWPWCMQVGSGSEAVLQWNLPQAADNPLFGLPPLPRQDLPASPFRHLHTFRREHAAVFFGRGALIRTLYDRVTDPDTAPIILFYGQSGVGKSSVLEAGLLPRLQSHYQRLTVRREATQGLWSSLQNQLTQLAESDSAQTAWLTLEQRSGQPLVMVFDQLEEVFTRANPEQPHELQQFIDGLYHLFGNFQQRPQGKLILSYRKEWSPEIESLLSAARLPFKRVFVEALDQRGILEAITGPANTPSLQQHYGLSIESSLAETIAHDLLADRGSPIAPVLQILLTRLWESVQHQAQPQFDTALYQTLKQQGLLLKDFLDQQFEALAHTDAYSEAVHSGLLLDVLMFFTTARGTANERSEAAALKQYAHQSALSPQLIEQCKMHYLLVSQGSESSQTARYNRLCHDALAPLIRERFEASDRPGQRARRILESRAVEWQTGDMGASLDAADLTLVEQGAQGMRVWTEDEERLITSSRGQRRKRRRQRCIWRALGALAMVLILATTALTGWQWRVAEQQKIKAQSEQAKAEKQSRLALARQWAAQAKIALDTDTGKGLLHSSLLSVESLKQTHTTQGTLAWTKAEALLPHAITTLPLPTACYVTVVAFDPTGKWLATGESGGKSGNDCNKVRLWNSETGQEVSAFKHDDPIFGLTFNSGSSLLATITGLNNPWGASIHNDNNTAVHLWKIDSGKKVIRLRSKAPIYKVRFNTDGTRLAIASQDKTARVFDTQTWQEISRFQHNNYVYDVKFSPDGKYIATRSIMSHVWETDTGVHLFRIGSTPEHLTNAVRLFNMDSRNYVTTFKFSLDSAHIATLDRNGIAKILSLPSGIKIHQFDFKSLGGHLFISSAFNHNISIAIASDGNRIYIFDLFNKRTLETPLISSRGETILLKLNPNQTQLLSVVFHDESESTGRIFKINSGEELFRFLVDHSYYSTRDNNINFAPDSSLIATVTGGKARILRFKENTEIDLDYSDMMTTYGSSYEFNGSISIVQDIYVAKKITVRDAVSYKISMELPLEELCANCYIETTNTSMNKKMIVFVPWKIREYNNDDEDYIGRSAQVYDLHSGQLIANVIHKNRVLSADLNFNGSLLATYTQDGENANDIIHLWDVSKKKLSFKLKHITRINSMKFIPDRALLIAGTDDSILHVWNASTGKEVTQQHGMSFKISPNNSWVSTITSNGIRILNHKSWELIADLSIKISKGDNIEQFFSSDGTRLIVIHNQNVIIIWDTHTWRITHNFLLDRDNSITNRKFVTFNEDHSLLVIKGRPDHRYYPNKQDKQRINIFNIETGEEMVRTWIPHSSDIIGFSQDGRWWTTYDKARDKFQQHPWRAEDLIADLCTRLPRNFTQAEWQQYMGDRPYQASCVNLPMS